MHKIEVQLQTPDANQKIWRYMDFSKYLDILSTNTIYFTRADRLEDPFDCSFMQFLPESAKKCYQDFPQAKDWSHKINAFERLFVYVNCWHINNGESAALWKLHSENKYETIAIQSTFAKLDCETKLKWPRDGIHISSIHYELDNAGEADDILPGGRLFSPDGWESIIF